MNGKYKDQIIFMTVGKYNLFKKNGALGKDALILWLFLVERGISKDSTLIKANNHYIKNGLNWGDVKLKKAKTFLVYNKIISYKKIRDTNGRFIENLISLDQLWDIEQLFNWVNEKGLTKQNSPQVQKMPQMVDTRHIDSSSNYNLGINEVYKIPKISENTNEKDKIKFFTEIIRSSIFDNGFEFPRHTKQTLQECFILFDNEYILSIFDKYMKNKSTQQIKQFHSKDLPSILRNEINKQHNKKNSVSPTIYMCPICNKRVKTNCGLNYCSDCGLEIQDFNNQKVINEIKSSLTVDKKYA